MMMKIDIRTIKKTLLTGEADEVVAPAIQGEVGILPHHASYVTPLKEGTIRVEGSEGGTKEFAITGGILEVCKDRVRILVDALQDSV